MTLVQCLLSAQAQERVWLQTPGLCLECSEGREACPFQQDWMERLRICGVPRLWTVLTRAVQEHSLGGMSGREQLGKHRKRQTALQRQMADRFLRGLGCPSLSRARLA